MDKIAECAKMWEDYENGRAYQAAIGLTKDLPEFVRFYEGKQWPAPTKNTRNLPRPVINIVKLICRSKKSAILSTPVRISYKAEDGAIDVRPFNEFAEFVLKEMGQSAIDKDAVHTGVTEGTYIYHYYWDADAKGKRAWERGALRCELIDPLCAVFSNPREKDEQKQKWIMISSREEVSSVRAKADKGVDKDLITPDAKESDYNEAEQDGDKLCTVLTRYFRKDGEVYFEKAVKGTLVNAPCALSPNVSAAEKLFAASEEETEDAPNNALPDSRGEGENLRPAGTGAYLYPIVVGSYEPRKGSIYGLSEVQGIVANQKAINFALAMMLLNNQKLAWGKYVVADGALRDQKITDEPGQVLTDYSGTGNGIKKLVEQGLQGQPLQLIDTIANLTRKITGATEVMSGEVLGANMSGSAIAQLQAQAKEPIKELRDSFWNVKEKQGLVLAQFFKLFYYGAHYTAEDRDENGNAVTVNKEFFGERYADVDFSVVVEATTGTSASAAGDISALDVLFSKGAISLETYISSYPDDALSNKNQLLMSIKEERESENAVLKEKLQAAERQLQEYDAAVKTLQQTIMRQQTTVEKAASVIDENRRLKEQYLSLYSEASAKIAYANEQIAAGNRANAEIGRDAENMAQVIVQHAPEAIV